MTMHYDLWMALGTLTVALGAVFGSARLALHLRAAQHTARCALITAPVLALALWALSFASIFVGRGPSALQMDAPLVLLSIESALIACGAAIWLGRHGHLRGMRLPAAVVALVAGALLTRYFAVAALHVVPAPIFDPAALAAFALGAAAAAFGAFGFGVRWLASASVAVRLGAVAVFGIAAWALHVCCLSPTDLPVGPFRSSASIDAIAASYAACGIAIALLVIVNVWPARAREIAVPDARLAG